jgi:hypothetical protein
MTPRQFWTAVAFAIVITLGMNALDMLYHVATNTAVHLNYVAVKATVIFSMVFLVALIVGRGKMHGVVTSILGPVMFYIYYTVATPTLNRALFTIDEAVWYIVVHAIALGLMYWLTSFVMKKGDRVSFAAATALTALPLYWACLMQEVVLRGGTEEQTTTVLPLASALLMLLILFVIAYGVSWIPKIKWGAGIVGGVVLAVILLTQGFAWQYLVVRSLALVIPYIIIDTTLRGES